MIKNRIWTIVACLLLATPCLAQSWRTAYEAGIVAARALKWDEARSDFKKAAAFRPDDVAAPTILPGPPTAQRRWRDGALYSPNFLAAYSGYRAAMLLKDSAQQLTLLQTVEAEFEALLAKKQVSRESYFILSSLYTSTADADKLKRLQDRYGVEAVNAKWHVDIEIVSPTELAAIAAAVPNGQPVQPQNGDTAATVPATDISPVTTLPLPGIGSPLGMVPAVPNKYALIIANRSPNLTGSLPYAAYDAVRVRDGLINLAGYLAPNVDTVVDATAPQIMERARALAARLPDSATVLIYFVGVGENVGGRDYLASSDASVLFDPATMVAKTDLYAQFLPKSARIFAFFESNRQISDGATFGSETPYVGAIAQMQATMPGDPVYSTYRNGKQTGLFTNAFVETLADLQSNQLPILEFGWQLFYRMRRGESGVTGGSSQQTCTLPFLNNLAADAKF